MVRPEENVSPELRQAIGMVCQQLGCSNFEARARLEIRSFATHSELDDVARAVIEGTVRFDDDPA